MPKEITTHSEALTCALALAITASTDTRAAESLEMAECFASWLTAEEIEKAKAQGTRGAALLNR
ncbi:MAG TPA: hypothetical protein VL200_06270 [Lacunisphaera sp.]|jgi:hypothetical protein|nr:hypothetical protein [Lacunisphaera sp.]